MSPVKLEPTENYPDTKPQIFECPPDIKSETIEFHPNVKSETIDYTPEIPPTKRLKTLTSDSPSSKGKSKIVNEEDDDALPQQQLDACGVCLLDHGMSLRGFIDSCEHYFCFVCIMEWAKVESRCPICKRRFSTIRRPPKDGVFSSERVVNIPVRDQVYLHNGNATLGPPDPYSKVKCSFCSHSSDEDLLLLCDLCDSSAHSYCVGLGATIPEDDWFCKDCTLSRDEHYKVETDTDTTNNDNVVRFAQSDVSIHDIVRETYTRERDTSSSSSSVPASVNQSEPVTERSNTQSNVDRSIAPNARTLQRCQNVHARINVLRENWDGFRGGSLGFSSTKNSNTNVTPDKGPYNVNKAWRMMDIAAKALGGNGNKSSKFPVKNERLSNDANMVRPKHDDIGTSSRNSNNKRDFSSSSKIIPITQMKNNSYDCHSKLSRKDCIGVKFNVGGSSAQSSSIAKDKCCAKKEIGATFKENKSIEKDRALENSKSEIQSLVKLNLKLLSKDNKLEFDVFKEIARHATHSIMAACGIEQPKARFRSFERLVCNHNQTHNRPISSLMRTSCRECFYVFVKDVVTTIASDRTNSFMV